MVAQDVVKTENGEMQQNFVQQHNSEKSEYCSFAYISEHCASFETKKLATFEEGGRRGRGEA